MPRAKAAPSVQNTTVVRRAAPRAKVRGSAPSVTPPRPGGKLGLIVDRLGSRKGATADELAKATGWRRHSVIGALSRLRARGFDAQLETRGARRAYCLEAQRD